MTRTVTNEAQRRLNRYLNTILLFIQAQYACGQWITWTPLTAHY